MTLRPSGAAAVVLATIISGFSLVAESADEAAPGKELFIDRCGGCHLHGGGGTLKLSKRLGKEKALLEQRSDLLPLHVKTVVRWGVGTMPWFTRVELTDAELGQIAEYLARNSPK